MYAAHSNSNPLVISVLLGGGAKIDEQDNDGLTALMLAARANQNPDVISSLVSAGADAKKKDKSGSTAFDYARSNDHLRGTKAFEKLKNATQ